MQVHDPLSFTPFGIKSSPHRPFITMQTSSRLYHCLLCHAQVIICHRCDRGNRYCTNGCSKIARLTSQKRSAIKYQQSRPGRFNNAARQKRFREQKVKKSQKVTHHRSQKISLSAVLNKPPKIAKSVTQPLKHTTILYCAHCGEVCNPFLRHDFLRGRTFKGHLRW